MPNSRSLAAEVRCDPEASSKHVMECLQKVSTISWKVTQLSNAFLTKQVDGQALVDKVFFLEEFENFPNPFKPVVDDFAKQPFLPKEPSELMAKGQFNKVPMIIGSNEQEGLLVMNGFMSNMTFFQDLIDNWNVMFLQHLLHR